MARSASRPSWSQYFLEIAEAVSHRATCPRAQVGAVIVGLGNRILSTGYNGAPPGKPHCIDEGCILVDEHCQRALHAEVNAVAHAARAGVSISGAKVYIVGSPIGGPCRECQKVLTAAGVVW